MQPKQINGMKNHSVFFFINKNIRSLILSTQLAVVLLFIVLFYSPTDASAYMTKEKKLYMEKIQELIYNDKFKEADSLNKDFISNNQNDPAGYLFQMGLLMAVMTDGEENNHEKEFNSYSDSATTIIDSLLLRLSGKDRAWYHLLKGHMYVYKSLWESRFGSKLSSVKLGYKAKGEYEKGLKSGSSCYDLYFGLGAFHYWKSAKAGLLRTLGFFSNDKKKGIKELKLAIDSSVISRQSARNAMIWIWIDRKDYDSAIATATEMLKKFPDGKIFLWPLAEAYYRKTEYLKGVEVLQLLREKLVISPGNYYNLIECDYKICENFRLLKQKQNEKKSAEKINMYLNLIPKDISKSQNSKIRKLLKISKEKI